MTPEQKELVQTSFTQLIPNSDSAARFFYHRLFQLDPKVKLLFKGDMQEQGRKLMHMIGVAVRKPSFGRSGVVIGSDGSGRVSIAINI